ncbi:hypothetical protein HOF92_02340 [bacterium]|jgi:hypothetical protein|nr:hypothetical protein [bacterium]
MRECRYVYPIDREVSLWLGGGTLCITVLILALLGLVWTGLVLGSVCFLLTYIFHLSQAEIVFREDGAIFLQRDEIVFVLSLEDLLRIELSTEGSTRWMKFVFQEVEMADIDISDHFDDFSTIEGWIMKSPVSERLIHIESDPSADSVAQLERG